MPKTTLTCVLLMWALLCLLLPVAHTAERTVNVTRYRVTTDHVKPEKMTEWRALQKNEVVPALHKAGVTSRRVYHTIMGDGTEFISYTPFPDYGELDGPDALERALGKKKADKLKQKLDACLLSTSSRLENSQNDFYFDPEDAPVLFSSRYRATSGRSADYMTFLHEHMLSPIKRAVDSGFIKGFQVMRTDQGGEVGLFILNMFYPDFDTLDQGAPAAHMMSREEMADFFRAGAGLITPLGQYIHAYEKDLSYY